MVSQILFIILFLITVIIAWKLYSRVISNIKLGLQDKPGPNKGKRWKNMLLVALGQGKMFTKPVSALFHLFIYIAFIVTQIELIEFIADGVLGTHRIFADDLGFFYTIVINSIEFLSVFALIATIIFLSRRNVIRVKRFHSAEMTRWPKSDANLILIGEILLIIAIFSMNGADSVLQSLEPSKYHDTGTLLASSLVGESLFSIMSVQTLHIIERFGWWLHILVVFGFILYLPISKHLHIIFAFINTWWHHQRSRGEMKNMPEIMNEVKSMMGLTEEVPAEGDIPDFGANDVFSLSRKSLLDAYTCTECGRCTSVCPANQTGKKLSPRKVIMDIRDRMEEVGKKIATGDEKFIKKEMANEKPVLNAASFDDGKSLFDYVTSEEIFACTTCNACVEICPVMIDPLEPILQMRRYEILTNSAGPQDWVPMFTSMENSGSVWQLADLRTQWTKE